MEVTELRIGNLVDLYIEVELETIPFKSHELNVYDLINLHEENGFYNPIPLTEDWLLKFGFKMHTGWDGMEYRLKYYTKYGIDIFPSLQGFEYENDLEIKHVHQLQNLYFALTGKELEFNLNE